MTTNAEKNYVIAKGMGFEVSLHSQHGCIEQHSCDFDHYTNWNIESNGAQAMEVIVKLNLSIARTVKGVTVSSPFINRGNYSFYKSEGKKEELKQLILNCAYEYIKNGGTVG